MTERHVAMVINPTSGKGRGGKNAPIAAAQLRARGLRVTEVQGGSAADTLDLAHRVLSEGADAIIACGGDGTVHLALQAAVQAHVPLGIIPVGTGDDNARTLGLPLGDAAAAADVIADDRLRTVDVGKITLKESGEVRFFLGVLSVGFDSLVTERANRMTWPTGKARYIVATLAELSTFSPQEFTLTIDGDERRATAMLIAIGNGRSYGGGMLVCPNAQPDDGLLDMTLLNAVSKAKFISSFGSVFKGTHINEPFVDTYRFRSCTIEAPGQLVFADGERVGTVPATIDALPDALEVYAPYNR